jgi:hypothetical protein
MGQDIPESRQNTVSCGYVSVISRARFELTALSMLDSQRIHYPFWITGSQLPEKRNKVFFLPVAQIELLNDTEEFNGVLHILKTPQQPTVFCLLHKYFKPCRTFFQINKRSVEIFREADSCIIDKTVQSGETLFQMNRPFS